MKWLAYSHGEKIEQWCGKAGTKWHEIIVRLRTANNEESEIKKCFLSPTQQMVQIKTQIKCFIC